MTDDGMANALSALEQSVRDELLKTDRLPEQLELRHRADDYQSWQRFALAPSHVEELVTTVSETLDAPLDRSELRQDILSMLTKLYDDLASVGPENPAD